MNKKKLAIMQPYFFPYIGYFQLISAVDTFLIYDNIKFTKKGWINRNRMLKNESDVLFSLPLNKDSDSLNICNRYISDSFNKKDFINKMTGAYFKAPYFKETLAFLEHIIMFESNNLFIFLYNSIVETCKYLGISTNILISSSIEINHNLKGVDKVIALNKALKADLYINAIGGVELYHHADFISQGIDLKFLRSSTIFYKQFTENFVSSLSIIDVLMFNNLDTVRNIYLNQYDLIT
jgi:hypothetical protein